MAKVNVRSGASLAVMSVLSLVGLTGIVFCPQFTYPRLWISPLMVFVLVQVALKESLSFGCQLSGLETAKQKRSVSVAVWRIRRGKAELPKAVATASAVPPRGSSPPRFRPAFAARRLTG